MFLRILLAAVLLLVPSAASAQSTLATVSGVVYDEQHRAVPGATITLKNLDTAQVRSAVSDGTGHYRVLGEPSRDFAGEVRHRTGAKHERRWQFADTFVYTPPDTFGDHAVKMGVELSAININGFQPAGFDGAFIFTTNTPSTRLTLPRIRGSSVATPESHFTV